jgi:DNA primase
VAVVGLPPGTDPDDVVRVEGGEAMRELLAAPLSLVEFLVQDLPDERAARHRAATEIATLVGAARDPHIRDELFLELTQRVGFSEAVLRDLARRMGDHRGVAKAPAARTSLAVGELFLARIILDGEDRWRRLIAREVDPLHRGDQRLGRLIGELRRFTERVSDDTRDFVRWLQEDVEDEELMLLVAEVSTAAGPELTDEAIKMQLRRVLLEQWKAQARDLTAQIRRAEDLGDDAAVGGLQTKLAEFRSRRPDF